MHFQALSVDDCEEGKMLFDRWSLFCSQNMMGTFLALAQTKNVAKTVLEFIFNHHNITYDMKNI